MRAHAHCISNLGERQTVSKETLENGYHWAHMQTFLHSGPEVDSRPLLYIPSYPTDCEHTGHPQTERADLSTESETEKQFTSFLYILEIGQIKCQEYSNIQIEKKALN